MGTKTRCMGKKLSDERLQIAAQEYNKKYTLQQLLIKEK